MRVTEGEKHSCNSPILCRADFFIRIGRLGEVVNDRFVELRFVEGGYG